MRSMVAEFIPLKTARLSQWYKVRLAGWPGFPAFRFPLSAFRYVIIQHIKFPDLFQLTRLGRRIVGLVEWQLRKSAAELVY